MPEGPEVKIFLDDTKSIIDKNTLISFQRIGTKTKDIDKIITLNKLLPSKVEKYFSKGKKIFMFLANGYCLVFSFGLTGVLVSDDKVDTENYPRYRRVYFRYDMEFSNEDEINESTKTRHVYFSDVISYGDIVIMTTDDATNVMNSLGPDFLSFKINISEWRDILELKNVKKRVLADFLLEQDYISGIGNKYRAEILYYAKISPLRKISELTSNEIDKIYKSIKRILKLGYSVDDWEPEIYEKSKDSFGNSVTKLKHKGRSLYYCPDVQK